MVTFILSSVYTFVWKLRFSLVIGQRPQIWINTNLTKMQRRTFLPAGKRSCKLPFTSNRFKIYLKHQPFQNKLQ